jgi:hypothetical protein
MPTEEVHSVDGQKLLSMEELRLRGVKNYMPPLPPAPCVKSRVNGRIFPWHKLWAIRSDVFVCCDEHGDESEAAWAGRFPRGYNSDSNPIPSPRYQAPPTPKFIEPEKSKITWATINHDAFVERESSESLKGEFLLGG